MYKLKNLFAARSPSRPRVAEPIINRPKLPQELIEAILDHLYDDQRTLLRAALVCRSWLPGARFHVPSLVFPIITPVNAEKLKALISHPASTIPRFLYGARVSPEVSNTLQELTDRGASLRRINLTIVAFRNANGTSAVDLRPLQTAAGRITFIRLCTRYLSPEQFQQAMEFVCRLDGLEELELELTASSAFRFLTTLLAKLPFGLKRLSLTIWPKQMAHDELLAWLITQRHCTNLTTLALRINGDDSIKAIIETFQDTLTDLFIPLDGQHALVNLADISNLASLHLFMEHKSVFDPIENTLNTISSATRLRTLDIYVCEPPRYTDWTQFDKLIDIPALHALEILRLNVTYLYGCSPAEVRHRFAVIRSSNPRLASWKTSDGRNVLALEGIPEWKFNRIFDLPQDK